MKKMLLIFLISALMSIGIIPAAHASNSLYSYFHQRTEKILIEGELEEESTAPVTMILIDKNVSPDTMTVEDFKYIDQTSAVNGKYKFYFMGDSLEKDISEYKVIINQAGSMVNSSIKSATRFTELFNIKVYGLTEKDKRATATAKVESIFGDDTGEYDMTMLLAYYTKSGKLVGVTKSDFNNISITQDVTLKTLVGDIPDDTYEIKAFIIEKLNSMLPYSDPRSVTVNKAITCWGDSLTAGAGGQGTTYPSVLKSLSGKTVYNMGVGGETATTIAARQGGLRMVLPLGVTIPAETTNVEVALKGSNGKDTKPLLQGSAGINPCYIQGIEGTLSYNSETKKYYFKRSTPGEVVTVSAGAEITTTAMLTRRNDIVVIFVGTNGGDYSTPEELISIQQSMIDYLDYQNKEYVIVGLTSGTAESRNALETAMVQKWGDRYIKMREYLSTESVLRDAGVTLSDADLADLAIGKVPQCIRVDTVHFNATGYNLLGKKIYEHMVGLGILE